MAFSASASRGSIGRSSVQLGANAAVLNAFSMQRGRLVVIETVCDARWKEEEVFKAGQIFSRCLPFVAYFHHLLLNVEQYGYSRSIPFQQVWIPLLLLCESY